MKTETMNALLSAARKLDLEDKVEGREDYSGRGMFGRVTAAFVCPLEYLAAIVAQAAFDIADGGVGASVDFIHEMKALKMDNMARDIVCY